MNNLNFIDPMSPKKQRAFEQWKQIALLSASIVAVLVLAITVYKGIGLLNTYRAYKEVFSRVCSLEEVAKKQHALVNQEKTIQTHYEYLLKRVHKRPFLDTLELIINTIPHTVALISITHDAAHKTIRLEIATYMLKEATQFADALTKSGRFEKVQMQSVRAASHGNRNEFYLTMVLNQKKKKS